MNDMNIEIEYDGEYPNLCRGKLIVIVDETTWEFERGALESGGSVTFDSRWNETVDKGKWIVNEWPLNFPDEFKCDVEQKINDVIPWGCCGGCV